MKCVDWMCEYVRVYQACLRAETILMENETIILVNDSSRNITKKELGLLLPNDATEYGGDMCCGFTINDYGRNMMLSGWVFSKISINSGLFITRLLYYHPNINLKSGNFQPILVENYLPASGNKQITMLESK